MSSSNYYPHTLKADDLIEIDSKHNKDLYDLSSIESKDDYLCVFENVGIEYPEIALGLRYKIARSKDERRKLCEENGAKTPKYNNYDTVNSEQGLIYIKRDDWIPNTDRSECAVFNKDGSRHMYEIGTPAPRTFVSKKLCDRYSDKDSSYNIYTKMIPRKISNPSINLKVKEVDDKYKNNSRGKIFWLTYIVITIFIVYWTLRYHVKKPYHFYDYINSIFVNKTVLTILIFGAIIYLFCPFNMCYQDVNEPEYRKDFNKSFKNTVCDYTNNNIGYLEESVCNKYDNSYFLKYLDKIFYYLFNFNRKIEKPLKYINSKVCNYCKVKFPCLESNPFITYDIIQPNIINYSDEIKENEINNMYVLGNDYNKYNYGSINLFIVNSIDLGISSGDVPNLDTYLKKINQRFNFINYTFEMGDFTRDGNTLLNTGDLIILKSFDEFNNYVFMNSLLINPDKDNQINYNYEDVDYGMQWIVVRNRKGPMIYNDELKFLRVKRCPYTYRIYSIDNNYELLDYNINLSVEKFIEKFVRNYENYKRYPYFPEFTLKELKSHEEFNKFPNFVKRKMIFIYRYMVSHPSQKLRAKNINIIESRIIRYDYIKKSIIKYDMNNKNKKIDDETNNYIKLFRQNIDIVNKFKILLNEINNYHNDDENEKDYLKFYFINELINMKLFMDKDEYIDKSGNIKWFRLFIKYEELFENEYKKIEDKKSYYTSANYKMNINIIYEKMKLNDKLDFDKININKFIYNLNLQLLNLNYIQREDVRKKITEKLLDLFNKKKKLLKFNFNKKINLESLIGRAPNKIAYQRQFNLENIINNHFYIKKIYEKDKVIKKCNICHQDCELV